MNQIGNPWLSMLACSLHLLSLLFVPPSKDFVEGPPTFKLYPSYKFQ